MSTAKCHNIALGISLVGCWFLCQEFRPKKSKNTMKALYNKFFVKKKACGVHLKFSKTSTGIHSRKKQIASLLFFGKDTEVSISSRFIIHPKKENQIHINQQCVESKLPFRTLIFKVGSGQLISEISVPKIDRKFGLQGAEVNFNP